ncbi:hypothetical protein BJX96DRAFT_173626 [Aspergillus floccosus]
MSLSEIISPTLFFALAPELSRHPAPKRWRAASPSSTTAPRRWLRAWAELVLCGVMRSASSSALARDMLVDIAPLTMSALRLRLGTETA